MRIKRTMFHRCAALIVGLAVGTAVAAPQTRLKPGINLFTIEQDVEMGRQAAEEIERKMPILRDRIVQRYITDLGLALAKKTDYPNLPWQFKVVNSSDVNAFALPGGFIYVNRGLIEATETEGELAGVLGHEISHVTLRHGTNQLTKAYLAQAPLAILGGIIGQGGWQAVMAKLGTTFVVNSLFLKFSRSAETQADIAGTQLLHAAGYDPRQMVRMFQLLRRLQGRDPGKLEEFFSSHPSPQHRIERIEEEIAKLPPVSHPRVDTMRFRRIRARLKAMPPPPKSRPSSEAERGAESSSPDFRQFRHPQGLYELPYPATWRVYRSGETGVVLAPDDGWRSIGGRTHLVYGAIVDLFRPQRPRRRRAGRLSLGAAVDQLVEHLRQQNPYLRPVTRRVRRPSGRTGGQRLDVILEGVPPGQRSVERVWVAAQWAGQRIVYVAFVSPQRAFGSHRMTFERMIRGLHAASR